MVPSKRGAKAAGRLSPRLLACCFSPTEPRMPPQPLTDLDYDLLDDVLPGITTPSHPLRRDLIGCRAVAIGPLVEYALQADASQGTLPPLREAVPSEMACALNQVLSRRWSTLATKTSTLQSLSFEFSRVPDNNNVSDPYMVAFVQRVKHAAVQAGFNPNTAKKLAASFLELTDNIWEHSAATSTGVVGYRTGTGVFEFVIADSGVGVIASMNAKPAYADLTDAGTALETALSLCETEYGRATGRGDGYRNMFANLTNLWGEIRVRSGDHGLSLDGTSLTIRSKRTFQTVHFQGFFVSVICRP